MGTGWLLGQLRNHVNTDCVIRYRLIKTPYNNRIEMCTIDILVYGLSHITIREQQLLLRSIVSHVLVLLSICQVWMFSDSNHSMVMHYRLFTVVHDLACNCQLDRVDTAYIILDWDESCSGLVCSAHEDLYKQRFDYASGRKGTLTYELFATSQATLAMA